MFRCFRHVFLLVKVVPAVTAACDAKSAEQGRLCAEFFYRIEHQIILVFFQSINNPPYIKTVAAAKKIARHLHIFFLFDIVYILFLPAWWNGRHEGLKILCPQKRLSSSLRAGTLTTVSFLGTVFFIRAAELVIYQPPKSIPA